MTYYDDIKRLRREAKMKKGEMASSIGVSRTYVGKIEKGAVDVRMSVLNRIANLLGKRIMILFIDKEEKQ